MPLLNTYILRDCGQQNADNIRQRGLNKDSRVCSHLLFCAPGDQQEKQHIQRNAEACVPNGTERVNTANWENYYFCDIYLQ